MAVSKDHYYRLGSEVPQERLEAAKQLLSELTNVGVKEDWDYALDRLSRGLTTTRQSARYGFSIALAEVLRELVYKKEDAMSLNDYLKLILEKSQVKSSMKGKEERAVLFGRLFGLQILINAGLILDTSISDEQFRREFISSMLQLANMKSWLREPAVFSLCQMIQALAKDNETSDIDDTFTYMLQQVNDAGLNLSTEGLAVYLSVPKSQRSSCASKVTNMNLGWKGGDPLSKGNTAILAKVLKDVDVIGDEDESDNSKKSKQKGSWNSRLPFVWDLILEELVVNYVGSSRDDTTSESKTSKKRKISSSKANKRQRLNSDNQISIGEFWRVVVEESLFTEKSSPERKYWGFEIFSKFLNQVDVPEVESIFTPNFMRTLINQSSQSSRLLNKISIKVLTDITEAVKNVPQKAPVVLSCLMDVTRGGCWNFDLVTKSKTSDQLLTFNSHTDDISKEEFPSVMDQIKNVLLKKFDTALEESKASEDSDTQELIQSPNENILKWILDKLLSLVRSNKKYLSSIKSSGLGFVDDILNFLVERSLFAVKGSKSVSDNIRKICIERLNSILAVLIESKRKKHSWSYYCVKIIKKLEASADCEPLLSIDDEINIVKNEAFTILDSIIETEGSTKSGSKRNQLYCFELLFSMGILQLYMGDEETIQMLDEIKMCYESTMTKAELNEEEDNAAVQTEIILAFIARKSLLLKKLSMIIWESLVSSKNENGHSTAVSEQSMQLLFDALVVRENKEGLQQLFEGEGEYDVDESKESDFGSANDDDPKRSESEIDSDSESENESDSADDDTDDETTKDLVSEVDKKTTGQLAKALGIKESSNEVKFDELDSASDPEESDSMDDQQMSAMDDQLARIFKERKNALGGIQTGNKRKEEVIEAKEQVTFFKNRIMDMLESFSSRVPNSYLNLKMLKPLLVLIQLTLDKNLGNKAHKLIKTKISKTRISQEEIHMIFPAPEQQRELAESLLGTMKWIQKRAASRKTNQVHSLACNQACIILAKNLLLIDDAYLSQILDIYAETMKSWAMDPKNKVLPSLFFDFINWLNAKRASK